MDIDTSALFAPIVINGHTVKNRLSVAPMTRISATHDGRATETMTRYYERFARGGFGTVVRFSFRRTVPRKAACAPRSDADRKNVQM